MYKIRPKTKAYIIKILEILKQGPMHVSEITRRLGLKRDSHFVVQDILNRYLYLFVDIEKVNLHGIRVDLVRFKDGKRDTQLEDVIRLYEIKKRLKSSPTQSSQ